MAITPYHLALNYIVYLVLRTFKVIKKGNYAPLWMMFASNIIDVDHLFRFFLGGPIFIQEYGLDKLLFHGWWNVLPICVLTMLKKSRWFALGWALHIFLDGVMVFFGLNAFLIKI